MVYFPAVLGEASMALIAPRETCVLIPAYNEGKNISRLAEEVKSLGFCVLIADDGSTDDTVLLAKKVSGVEVLMSDKNDGKGAALRRGFEFFLGTKQKALIMMDADGQHHPEELPIILQALNKERVDFVVGNRMRNPKGMPWERVLTNRFLSSVISFVAGQKIPDSQCGYRGVKRQVLEKSSLKTNRFEIESEMLLEAARLGFKISSVEVSSHYGLEKSKIHPLRDTIRFFKFIFAYIFKKKFN